MESYNKYENNWDTSLFDCMADKRICLYSLFCSCCQGAYLLSALEGHPCGVQDGLKLTFCSLCYFVKIRGEVRKKYTIDGSIFIDLVTLMFCPFCAVAQTTRQYEIKEAPVGMHMTKT
eukprot:TRINITY_DN2713_c0_g1_i1.p1 TRINITY_DN2713_c0_g1~~TRINITY_DN2713_c0_g1_i1.p1  ORF type:complete len:118 (+),score=13.21 TRINITY_DN2713_c0_g1_i1:79-432(+)